MIESRFRDEYDPEPPELPSAAEYDPEPTRNIPRTVGEWHIALDYRPTPSLDQSDNPF